ncbi:MAG: hypothetical protein QW840_02260 [Candidatus Bathyarchaeia archaeon]
MTKMELQTNAPPEKVFRWVNDYFTSTYMKVGRSAEITVSETPSYIKVNFGSWFTAMGNPRGVAEVFVSQKGQLTTLDFRLSFKKEYLKSVFFFVVILIAVASYFLWQIITLQSFEYFAGTLASTLFMALFIFAVLATVSAVNVSLTKGRLANDFADFLEAKASSEENNQLGEDTK